MTARHASTLTALMLALFTTAPRAESLGAALDSALVTGGASALADAPPPVLESLHRASDALGLHGRGLVSDEAAAGLLVAELRVLADAQAEFHELAPDTRRALWILQGRVVVDGARELARLLPRDAARSHLLAAAARLAEATLEAAERQLHSGTDGPDHACFQQYGHCMEYCAELGGFVERSLCGMDCNLDFAVCLGSVVRDGGRELLGGMIEVVGESSER